MALEQTVEIPEDRKVQFSTEVPVGRFRIVFFPETPEPKKDPYAWRTLRGMGTGSKWTTEELFKERARDLLMEEAKLFGKISPEALEKAAKRGVTPAELGLEEYV
jgi:hypothetical protein